MRVGGADCVWVRARAACVIDPDVRSPGGRLRRAKDECSRPPVGAHERTRRVIALEDLGNQGAYGRRFLVRRIQRRPRNAVAAMTRGEQLGRGGDASPSKGRVS
jgi:hypothetical protein